jgi:hypothetical protein
MDAITIETARASRQAAKPEEEQEGFPIPECCPYERSSDLAKVFAVLYAHRGTGIAWLDAVACYRRWTLKDINRANYDVQLVVEGKGLPKGAQLQWVVNSSTIMLRLGERPAKPETRRQA